MPDFDSHAIHAGSTPLNSGPESKKNVIHRFDNDQPDDYIDPVTAINTVRPLPEPVAEDETTAE